MNSKKNKLVIDKYEQPIFTPNRLYVSTNYSVKDIQSRFKYFDGTDLDVDVDLYDGTTYSGVLDKDQRPCIVILINSKLLKKQNKTYKYKLAAHEAFHAAHRILENVGIYLDSKNSEIYAYMTEWVTECILKTIEK